MTKSFKPTLIELLWLAVAFIIALLICRFVFFWDFERGTLDIHLHDTYFVFTAATIIVPVFLLVTFTLYFIKETRKRFGRTPPNIVLFVAGLLSIILLAFVNKEFIKLGMSTSGGWAMYPPLSALPQVEQGNVELDPFATVVTNAMTVLQIIITVALLYAAFHWGRRTKQGS